MHPDTREFYAVLEGQMRFTLEGQPEPIVATRGAVINIPKKTAYSAEVIGSGPALWVAANQQNFKTLHPVSEPRPAQTAGFTVMKVGLNVTPGAYGGNNKPHFNLFEAEKDPKFNGQNVVQDDHMWAQVIWGYERICRRTIPMTRDTFTLARPSGGSFSKDRSATTSRR